MVRQNYYGFIQGHYYLKSRELLSIKKNVGKDNPKIVNEFEIAFASLVSSGEAISYAAGRIAF